MVFTKLLFYPVCSSNWLWFADSWFSLTPLGDKMTVFHFIFVLSKSTLCCLFPFPLAGSVSRGWWFHGKIVGVAVAVIVDIIVVSVA